MFYFLFKKIYLKIKEAMEKDNNKRLKSLNKPPYVKIEEYSYLNDGNQYHQFNIYRLEGETKKPVIIDIHGGAWVAGDKQTNSPLYYELVKEGYTVVALSYRLIDTCLLEEQVKDIFSFLHYLEANQEKLGLDLSKVVLRGDSAGGQLALLSLVINQREDALGYLEEKAFNLNVTTLILNHSVCYLEQAAVLPKHYLLTHFLAVPGFLRMLYGKRYEKNFFYQNTLNPEIYLTSNLKLPPILVISSLGDKEYSYQSQELVELLRTREIDFEYYFSEDIKARHVFNIVDPNSVEGSKCNSYIINFIQEHSL